MTNNKQLASAIAIAITGAMAMSASVYADREDHRGVFAFKPIDSSANSSDWDTTAPWKVPQGFTQSIVSDETDLNVYPNGQPDWPDMNTVNETGKMAGRYLYRTHELRSDAGAVSVVDLKTGEAKILAQDADYHALDGIQWTPWGTILFAEETTGGRLFEITLDENDMMSAASIDLREQVGLLAHEGIDIGNDGSIYVVDEHRGQTSGCGEKKPCGGGVYKFVPNTYGDLSAGSLYALKVHGQDGTGKAEWVGPIDSLNARESGSEFGGESYQRPEDLEIIGNTLYVAITEGPRDVENNELYEGRVIAINLSTMMVTDFVKPGVNVPVEIGKPGEAGFQTGFDNPDNLAESADGRLIIIEDNVPSDIWFASKETNSFGAAKSVKLFASLTDPKAEGTGIYFGKDPKTLFVNVQHSAAADGDATWAITKVHGDD